ncbi:hypothetical protein [Pontibacter rugosus]|uniref:hypothetical protein n=1 Tax=Pontibacter rugosus TaxID=1745966 RepID=UPI00366D6109
MKDALETMLFPVFMGLMYTLITLPDVHKDIVQAKYAAFVLFVASLLLCVPKNFVAAQLQQLF